MKIDLNPEERGYLLGLLREHLDFYRMIAANPKCSVRNHGMHQFLETLVTKLTQASPNGHKPKTATELPFRQ